ncbi:MAG: ChaN family lipoprotein, partial [Bacteroidota bacterium]
MHQSRYSFFFLAFFVLLSATTFGQSKEAFKIYNKKGKKVKYKKLLKQAKKQDIILFGEIHNNPISHWLELELAKDLSKEKQLTLGAEMIERDNQISLTDYLEGKIDYYALDSLARLWPNYKTDYAPLVDLAKANQLPFIGTNIPRRFASNVYYEGGFEILDQLSAQEKSWVAPLPIPFDPELPQYKNILTMMG